MTTQVDEKKIEETFNYYISRSTIHGAGMGAFANKVFEKGERLGEYTGTIINKDQWLNSNNQDYMYRIEKDEENDEYEFIDGNNKHNWLRYVNGAKTDAQKKELINVECYQHNRRVFFKALHRIPKGTEFIIDYGDAYWDEDIDKVQDIQESNVQSKQMQCKKPKVKRRVTKNKKKKRQKRKTHVQSVPSTVSKVGQSENQLDENQKNLQYNYILDTLIERLTQQVRILSVNAMRDLIQES